jgi:hypothetical protein
LEVEHVAKTPLWLMLVEHLSSTTRSYSLCDVLTMCVPEDVCLFFGEAQKNRIAFDKRTASVKYTIFFFDWQASRMMKNFILCIRQRIWQV